MGQFEDRGEVREQAEPGGHSGPECVVVLPLFPATASCPHATGSVCRGPPALQASGSCHTCSSKPASAPPQPPESQSPGLMMGT